MCPKNITTPRNNIEINGSATLCFEGQNSSFKGSLESEDGAQYAIYGTIFNKRVPTDVTGNLQIKNK